VKLIALETATREGSVALWNEGRLVERDVDLRGEGVLAGLERLLREHRVAPAEIGAVAVSVGPGSFTGVRIGVAAAQGFCFATGASAVPVGTLESLALSAVESDWGLPGTLVLPSLDARRDEVYAALYRIGAPGSWPERLWGPEPIHPRVLAEKLAQVLPQGGDVGAAVLCGGGADQLSALFPEASGWAKPSGLARARASMIARAALRKLDTAQRPEELEPVYLRKSDAEINREKRLSRP
jgi:tRNA threonylcarbamoyladenosine biosynthesis protein TsaB